MCGLENLSLDPVKTANVMAITSMTGVADTTFSVFLKMVYRTDTVFTKLIQVITCEGTTNAKMGIHSFKFLEGVNGEDYEEVLDAYINAERANMIAMKRVAEVKKSMEIVSGSFLLCHSTKHSNTCSRVSSYT